MRREATPSDAARFVQLATRERMLPADLTKELVKQVKRSGKPPGAFLIDSSRMSAIQVEAIEGLLFPDSVAEGYEVVGLLGHGGIGVVYRARQPGLDRIVALKTISATRVREARGGKGSSSIARFQQEAVAIAKLKHPNIVAAYDYGETADRLYLAMEMVDGIDLESRIKQVKQIDEASAWRLAHQVASALAHALESGIIHRDIKPANLLLTDPPAGYPLPAGTPLLKVTDFGLARLASGPAGEQQTRLTMTGATMGTPHYMAPEQIDDAQVGQHADIYALGATVYHMIVGQPPLAGLSLMKIFAAKLSGDSGSFEALPAGVSEPTRRLLGDMLRHEPKDRPQNYGELLDRINGVLGDETVGSTVSIVSPLSLPRGGFDTSSGISQTLIAPPPRRPWLAALTAGAFLVALVGGGVWWSRAGAEPEPYFVASDGIEAQDIVPLYRGIGEGIEFGAWQGVAEVKDAESNHFNTLKITGKAQLSLDPSDRLAWLRPNHFGFQVRVARQSKDVAVEIRFETLQDGLIKALRIEGDSAAVGVREGETAEFASHGDPKPLILTDLVDTPTLRIHRDRGYWFAYQIAPEEPEPRLIGWVRSSDQPPAAFSFKRTGGDAFLGEPQLVALLPAEETSE